MAAERIGLLGGTFDPPHAGHVAAARSCLAALRLDRLLLVVANCPWQKVPDRSVTPAEDRFAMVAAAVEGIPRVEASRIEIDRGGPSYTVDTVEALVVGTGTGTAETGTATATAGPEVFLVVGADLVEGLRTWKRWQDLRRQVTLAVVTRPGTAASHDPEGWRVAHVEGPGIDVSSSGVRRLLRVGRPVEGLVPDAVVRCIRRRGLYAVRR
ncbi:MAG: nicotinate-nucleotide adenylyltransferase [Acidimicrobiales bacterium]